MRDGLVRDGGEEAGPGEAGGDGGGDGGGGDGGGDGGRNSDGGARKWRRAGDTCPPATGSGCLGEGAGAGAYARIAAGSAGGGGSGAGGKAARRSSAPISSAGWKRETGWFRFGDSLRRPE